MMQFLIGIGIVALLGSAYIFTYRANNKDSKRGGGCGGCGGGCGSCGGCSTEK